MPPPGSAVTVRNVCLSVNLWPFMSVDSQRSTQITARLINDYKMSVEIKKKKEGVDWIKTDLIDTNTTHSDT